MKKGFTLVEIIISIGLIVIIGTISIFSFNLIKKNNKEKTLNNMSDEILTALRLYIETNKESKDRIYGNQEGMAITLEKLQNEGLVDFGDLKVDDKDYVVAFLSQESGCSDITTVKSWDLTNGPLYICSKGGSQNLFSVGGDATNLSQATRETYYFIGNAKNYVQLSGDTSKTYRIISVEKDDSLILYYKDSFGNVFNNKTLPITAFDTEKYEDNMDSSAAMYQGVTRFIKYVCEKSGTGAKMVPYHYDYDDSFYEIPYKKINGEAEASYDDLFSTSLCDEDLEIRSGFSRASNTTTVFIFHSWVSHSVSSSGAVSVSGYKIHLKPCMKIKSGTGDYANPYILVDNCTI